MYKKNTNLTSLGVLMQKQKTNATSYLNPVKKSVSGNASIKSALRSAPWIATGLSVRKNAE